MPDKNELSHEMKLVHIVLSERLKKLRDEKGITTLQLSQETGISVGALNYYERGKRSPDLVALYKLCKYYNVSADWLFGMSDQRR